MGPIHGDTGWGVGESWGVRRVGMGAALRAEAGIWYGVGRCVQTTMMLRFDVAPAPPPACSRET